MLGHLRPTLASSYTLKRQVRLRLLQYCTAHRSLSALHFISIPCNTAFGLEFFVICNVTPSLRKTRCGSTALDPRVEYVIKQLSVESPGYRLPAATKHRISI